MTMGKTVNKSDPYGRVWFRGHQFDNRTVSALKWAEARYLRNQKTGKKRGKGRTEWRIGQGSFANGSMSAGTHSGGGAVDIMFAGLGPKQRKAVVKWLKKAGFAAWAREGAAWGTNNDHAHGILMGHKTTDPQAELQCRSYRAGRDGLAGDRPDPTWRPDPMPRWSHRQNKPIPKW